MEDESRAAFSQLHDELAGVTGCECMKRILLILLVSIVPLYAQDGQYSNNQLETNPG